MKIQQIIEKKLRESFSPSELEIINESADHASHNEQARITQESHFRVKIRAAYFKDKSRVDRQRMVYDALREELQGPIHALALKVLADGE